MSTSTSTVSTTLVSNEASQQVNPSKGNATPFVPQNCLKQLSRIPDWLSVALMMFVRTPLCLSWIILSILYSLSRNLDSYGGALVAFLVLIVHTVDFIDETLHEFREKKKTSKNENHKAD